jgi:hypothetical protein
VHLVCWCLEGGTNIRKEVVIAYGIHYSVNSRKESDAIL